MKGDMMPVESAPINVCDNAIDHWTEEVMRLEVIGDRMRTDHDKHFTAQLTAKRYLQQWQKVRAALTESQYE